MIGYEGSHADNPLEISEMALVRGILPTWTTCNFHTGFRCKLRTELSDSHLKSYTSAECRQPLDIRSTIV